MGVRYRKYFQECKPIPCNGRPNKRYCPCDRPKRSNGDYKTCGVWCIEFFDDSKEWQSLTFKDIRNKSDAERRLTLFISDRERGQLNLPKKKAIPTLAEYSKVYMGLYRAAKENTRLGKERSLKGLVKYLGDYQLDRITPFVIEKYRVERKEKDKVGSITINVDIATLSHLFTTAIKAGILDKNPCKEVKKFKIAQTRDRVLSIHEIGLLLDSLQGKDRLMTLVSILTGMRLNEVLSLKWHDIDLAKGQITFIQSKTGKLIVMPLSSCLINELLEYKTNNPGDNLFDDRVLTKAIVTVHSNRLAVSFKRILQDTRVSFHTLRHTFTSIQGDLGTGANTVRELLGHSDLSMTTRYSHSGMEIKIRAIEALTSHVMNNKTETTVYKTGSA